MTKHIKQLMKQKKNLNKNSQLFVYYWFLIFAIFAIPAVFYGEPIVQVIVEITEINNNKAKELGIGWSDEIRAGEVLGEVPSIVRIGDLVRYTELTSTLKFLAEKGAAKIMSKPKIATKSGSSAKFLVGGAIPIISAGVGGGTIEWKEYGIKIEVKPQVVQEKQIDIHIIAEVSRIDWINKVGDYPALSTRQAESYLRIKNNETIIIAGLDETKKEQKTRGIPFLMDIPVLGLLFSRKCWIDVDTTVMIFVTPVIID